MATNWTHSAVPVTVWYDLASAPTTEAFGKIGDFALVRGSAVVYVKTAATTWASYTAQGVAASEGTAGIAEIATQGETNTGTDDLRFVTPLKLKTYGGTLANVTDVLHDNVAGEIAALTNKATPVAADYLPINDSAAANAIKQATIGTLPIAGQVTGTLASATVAASVLTGGNAANTADDAVLPAIQVVYPVAIAGGADADKDITITHKTRIYGALVIKKNANGTLSTITVKNGATAITDAIATVGADKTMYEAATIDDASYEIAASGTLRVSSASGAADAPACLVLVFGYRVA